MNGRTITFTVKRAPGSAYEGCDTPQLYIAFPGASSDPKTPNKVLKYFQKTCEAQTVVKYTLSDRDLSSWDVRKKQWTLVRGTFGLLVASSAQGGAGSLSGSLTV